MTDKIINTFQQRRQLALDIAKLAQTEDQRGLILASREIYNTYPKRMIQSELLKKLDTPDSQLRGGLGQLAALLPREDIGPALRSIAVDRNQSAQSRLTAVMLLSQFVGESVPQALLSDLNQTNEVARQSLREAIEEGSKNRHILLEYVLQMRQAGDHVPPLILDLLDQQPVVNRVELLRLIALDDREAVATDALRRLEMLASLPVGQDALRALHVLQYMLSPNLTGYAEDALRRLRFRGTVYRPPQPIGWRALMTIPALNGWQVVWFLRMPSDAGSRTASDGAALYLTLNNHTGEIHGVGDEQMGFEDLPPEQPVGQIMRIETSAERMPEFMEVPFDFARWRVLKALPAQWERASELPPDFRLYSDQIWQFARPEVAPGLLRFFQEPTEAGPTESANTLDSTATDPTTDPAMANWLTHNRSILNSLRDLTVPDTARQRTELAKAILAQLQQQPEGQEIRDAMPDALRAQAAWFQISGNTPTADFALTWSNTVRELPISQNPLLLAVIEDQLKSHSVE